MTRKHENVSAEYCPKKDTIETIPLSRNRDLGHIAEQKLKKIPLLTNCNENMRIFYAICDTTVSMCDLITQKAEKLTNFRHFRLGVSLYTWSKFILGVYIVRAPWARAKIFGILQENSLWRH